MAVGLRFATPFLLVAAACAPMSGAAAPFPVDFTFQTDNGVAFEGALNATFGLSGITYEAGGAASVLLEVTDAQIQVLGQSYISHHADPVGGGETPPQPAREIDRTEFSGRIEIRPEPGAMVHFLPMDTSKPIELDMAASGPGRLTTNRDLSAYEFYPETVEGRDLLPSVDAGRFVAPSSPLVPSGDVLVVVYGARLTLHDGGSPRDIATGPSEPLGIDQAGVRLTRDERVYAVIQAAQPFMRIEGQEAWLLHASTLLANLNGDASFTGVTGFSGTPTPPALDSSLIQVAGDLQVLVEYDKSQSWQVTGQATHFGVDGNTILGQRGISVAVLAASAGLSMTAVAWFARRLLFNGLAGIAGYNTADPLGNETRVKMLAHVLRAPGIGVGDLVRALEVRRATVLFHATVLAGAGYIKLAKPGAHWRFLPEARVAKGALPSTSVEYLACTQHPVRRRIADMMEAAERPLTAAEIRHALAISGLAISHKLLGYHLPIMAQRGVIRPNMSGRNTTYELAKQTPPASNQPSMVLGPRVPRLRERSLTPSDIHVTLAGENERTTSEAVGAFGGQA